MKITILFLILVTLSSFSTENEPTGALQVSTPVALEVVVKSEIKQTSRIKKEVKKKNKLAQKLQKADSKDLVRGMDSKLKIGLVLMGIGVVLTIVGISTVGGIAALVGLGFTIVGLLHTY
jgi:hypothetical protein